MARSVTTSELHPPVRGLSPLAPSLLAAALGLAALVGWHFDVGALKSVAQGWTTMKPNAAFGMILCGAALGLLSSRRLQRWRPAPVLAAAAGATAVWLGLTTLGEHLFDIDLGVDRWLVDVDTSDEGERPGRMAPTAAFGFALAGCAIVLAASPMRARLRSATVAAVGASLLIIGGVALCGYVSDSLARMRWLDYTGMAAHTAVGFLLLGSALLALVARSGELRWSMDASIVVGFVAAVLAMLGGSAIVYKYTDALARAVESVSRSHQILRELEEVAHAAATLESIQRGYVLTGEERSLAQRDAIAAELAEQLAHVRRLVADQPDVVSQLELIGAMIDEGVRFGGRIIDARRKEGFPAAQALAATDGGNALAARIGGLLDTVRSSEEGLLHVREAAARDAVSRTFLLLPLGAFACLTLLCLGLFFVNDGFAERLRAELALRESEELFSKAFRLSPDGIAIVNAQDLRLVRANETLCRLLGRPAVELIGKPAGELAAWLDAEARDALPRTLVHDADCVELETTLRTAEGREHTLLVASRMLVLNDEPCILSVVHDTTERRQSEEMQRRLAAIVNASEDAIAAENLEGVITNWNPGAEKVFGYTAAEAIGMRALALFPPEIAADEPRFLERLRRGESLKHYETVRVRKDGRRIDVAVTLSPIADSSGKVVGIAKIARDITERKRAENALRASEERFRTTLDNILEGCQLIGFDWRYLYLNNTAAIHNRRPNHELLGERMPDVWPGIRGTPVFTLLERCIETRIAAHDEIEFVFPDGSSGWFDVRVQPVPEGVFVLSIDISERKSAELALRRLNETLEAKVAERTAELEAARTRAESADTLKTAFLATMSHELRTPLNSVLGFTGILQQGMAGPMNAEQTKQLGMIRGSAQHLLELINDVLDISKIEAGQMRVAFETFDPRPSIERVIASVRPMAERKQLAIDVALPAGMPTMVSDRRRFEQILINLLNNAVKFTERGRVALAVDVLDSGAAARQIRLRVSDTGIGIRAEDLPTLFQPFRQLDSKLSRQHEGTGLGLAICRRLAGMLGGEIAVQSAIGRGSTFELRLPLEARSRA
ncbi:MAG TPA: PAS domain S-box protein [Rudaea sp.]|nr:PAS domain S-box protein [Rudaea sp.]